MANVTVSVRLLTPEALAHAAPLALAPTTPADLTRGWSPAVCSFIFIYLLVCSSQSKNMVGRDGRGKGKGEGK